jgi:hypothetical protein
LVGIFTHEASTEAMWVEWIEEWTRPAFAWQACCALIAARGSGRVSASSLDVLASCLNVIARLNTLLLAVLFSAFLGSCSPAGPDATRLNATASRVVRTTRRQTTQLVTLRTSKMTVETTPEHRFAKLGAGWTPASELAVGDRLVTHGTQDAALVGVDLRQVSPTPVYNLTVAKTHAYFVSEYALLVHNADCGEKSLEDIMKEQAEAVKNRQRALKERFNEQRRERKRQEIQQEHAAFQKQQRDKPRAPAQYVQRQGAWRPVLRLLLTRYSERFRQTEFVLRGKLHDSAVPDCRPSL